MKEFHFSAKDVETISKVLGVEPVKRVDSYRFVLENTQEKRKLSLEIYPDIPIGSQTGNLISIYTMNSHIQLHFCNGYVPSESLGEVIFIGESGGHVSGLIVEKGAGCSLYANLDSRVLSGDFTQMAPEVMMSGIALSVAEHLIPNAD
ncbi:MAG TPA: hypothetical protein PKV71_11970 [Calditrichia bacterium]|nr:hypothetical protein [Calditrichota bacterium]HQU71280.1 hypothetical protein [Calditrichia bacterium]HQV32590.1 hypothetical protein [Calditrichia bacterium]